MLFSVCAPLKAPDFLAKKLRKGTILRPDGCDIQGIIEIERPGEGELGFEWKESGIMWRGEAEAHDQHSYGVQLHSGTALRVRSDF